jgi:hypothetical protein
LYQLWGPPSLLFDVHRGYFIGESGRGCDVHDSPPYGAEIKNEWSSFSIPPYAFMALTGKLFLFAFLLPNFEE